MEEPRNGPTKDLQMNRLAKTLAPLFLLAGLAVVGPAESHAAPAETEPSATASPAAFVASEALAWCTKPNDYGVRCDGPTQSTETRDPVHKSLGYVGCKNPRSWTRWGGGMLYFCGRPLKHHERDIRAKYGVTGA